MKKWGEGKAQGGSVASCACVPTQEAKPDDTSSGIRGETVEKQKPRAVLYVTKKGKAELGIRN